MWSPANLYILCIHLVAILICNNLTFTTSSLDGMDPPPPFSGKDVTSLLLEGKLNEEFFPAAFGDFNADKLTDVFTVARNRSAFSLFLAHEEDPLLRLAQQCDIVTKEGLGVDIQGITVGDFSGDGLMDVMVTFVQLGTKGIVEVQIFKGNVQSIDCKSTMKGIELLQEPLMVDIDGDMIMDLVGESWVDWDNPVPCAGKQWHLTGVNTNGNDPPTPSTTTTTPAPPPASTLGPSISKSERCVWKFIEGKNISYVGYKLNPTNQVLPLPPHYSFNQMETIFPSSNSIVDIDGDTVPELVSITVSEAGTSHPFFFIEQYRIHEGDEANKLWNFDLVSILPLDQDLQTSMQLIGQSLFVDLNQDGQLEHLIPFCMDKNCHHSGFKVVNSTGSGAESILELDVLFKTGGTDWSFVVNKETTQDTFYTKTITLRVGDYNMDGFPDLIGVLQTVKGSWTDKSYKAVIFENIPCEAAPGNGPCNFPRTFRLDFESLAAYENVTMATFYDIYEDGLLDVLLVSRTQKLTSKQKEKYSAFACQSHPDYDANFLKVVVTTGIPCPKCPLAGIPYGNVIPGPVVRYNTVTQVGDQQTAVAAQLYRSSHVPLDLPYIFFGIGHSPNFIETLNVSVSRWNQREHHEWTQLIPNSQIIVIPSPPNKSWEWKAKIFLPSNKAALHTFGVLMGFVATIVFLVLLLHWKERREDRQERLLESRRFHMM